jgi:hypothetical protein
MQPSLDLLAAGRINRAHMHPIKGPDHSLDWWLASGTRRGFTLLLSPKQRTGFF